MRIRKMALWYILCAYVCHIFLYRIVLIRKNWCDFGVNHLLPSSSFVCCIFTAQKFTSQNDNTVFTWKLIYLLAYSTSILYHTCILYITKKFVCGVTILTYCSHCFAYCMCVDKVNHVIVSSMQCCVYEWWLDVQNPLFLKLQVIDVTLYTACFNTRESSFFTLTLVFVSCDSDNKRQLFSLNSMKWLGLIVKTPCLFFFFARLKFNFYILSPCVTAHVSEG